MNKATPPYTGGVFQFVYQIPGIFPGAVPASHFYNGIAAAISGIYIMGDGPDFQFSLTAHSAAASARDVQIVRKHELDAFHLYIPACRIIVSRYGKCLHAAGMFHTAAVYFSQYDPKRYPFVRADIFHSQIQLDDPAGCLRSGVSQIDHGKILTAFYCEMCLI